MTKPKPTEADPSQSIPLVIGIRTAKPVTTITSREQANELLGEGAMYGMFDPPPPAPFPEAMVRDVVQSLADREQFRKRSVRGWLRMLVAQIAGAA